MDNLTKIYPETPEAISEIIADAKSQGKGVIPYGRGNLVNDFINTCSKKAIMISTQKLNKIEDLDIGNLSVRVQAGRTLAELQGELKEHNLFLPISVESHGHRTLGGLAIENAAGLEGYAYGTIQEYILGLEFVTPEGDVIKTGGKTVKNVSGYDFTRLFSRSWGTLGIITSLTLALKPVPEEKILLEMSVSTLGEALNLAKQIKAKRLSLLGLRIFTDNNGKTDVWKLVAILGGFKETVKLHSKIIKVLSGVNSHSEIYDTKDYWNRYYQKILNLSGKRLLIKGDKTDFWDMEGICNEIISWPNVLFCEIDLGMGEIGFYIAKEYEEQLQQKIVDIYHDLEISFDWLKPETNVVYQKIKKTVDPDNLMFPCNNRVGGGKLD